MWYGSDDFDTFVKQAHTVCSKIEVWNGSKILVNSDEDVEVSLIEGSVQVQRMADIRRTMNFTVTLANKTFYKTYFDPLLGYDIRLYRGILYPDNTREYIPLGVFKLDTVTTEAQGERIKMTASGFDRARLVAQNAWTGPYSIASGTAQTAAIEAVITNRATGFTPTFNIKVSATTTPALFYSQNDAPWEQVKALSEGIGYETFFDPIGAACVFPVPDPTKDVVSLDLTAGPNGVRLGNLVRSINMQETYNGVIVKGSAPWLLFPVSGEAWDDDPASPTWRGGAFGARPKFVDSAVVTSGAQATAAAQAELYKVLGKTEQIDFSVLPDPRLDAGDIVRIYDAVLDIYGTYVLETLSIPMLSGAVTGTTRLYTRSVAA